MTNISQALKPRPDRPVEPLALRVISEIHQTSRELGFPVFLVGAVARIILLENIHGLQAGRGTTDVDFAFALDNCRRTAGADFSETLSSLWAASRLSLSLKLSNRTQWEFHKLKSL